MSIWYIVYAAVAAYFAASWLAPDPPRQDLSGADLTKPSTNDPLKKIYGKVEKSTGSIVFKETSDNDNDERPNDLLHIIVVWGYDVESIDEVYLDDIGVSTANSFFFFENIRIVHARNFPNGMVGYSDPLLESAGWNSTTDNLEGCACSYIRLEYIGGQDTLNTEPTISADLTGTTFSNPMTVLQDYVTSDIYGKNANSSNLDLIRLTAEAGICDSTVETYAGSGEFRNLFTFNGALSGEDTVLDNIIKILKSCRAYLPILNGKMTPVIEKDDPPVPVEIVEGDVLELGTITNSNKNKRYNRVVIEYYEPTANATKQEAFYPDKGSAEEAAWLAQDNDVLLEKTIKLHSCRNYYEAYSYAKTYAEVSRQQLRTELVLPAWATIFEVGDIVNVSHSYPNWIQKPFRIESTEETTDDDSDEVLITIREHQPASYIQPGESQPPEIPDTGGPGNGDTVTPGAESDYTETLKSRLQALVDNGAGGELVLAAGDYYITDTLPLASNITIRGAGMPAYRTEWLYIDTAENVNGKAVLTLSDPASTGYLSHRIMSGDVVKIDNASDSKLTGIKEVYSVDPDNSQLTLASSATNDASTAVGGRIRLSILVGGTIIRFQNHETGNITTNKRFFDCQDVRNFCLYDIGFVGPGVNAVFGGGMRFRRIRELDGRSRAITGYHWNNVLLTHSAMEGIRFDQLIHSYIGHLAINRCVDDGILFKAGPEGGTTTSVHIDTPYIQNCRRGIAFYTAAYCTITNPVVEGTSYGYYVNRGIGMTLNSMASETIKFDSVGQSGGVTGMFINSYGIVINGPTVYYNTEEEAWSKAALVFIDPGKRTESPTAVINGGHIHWSLGQKIPVVATRWNERNGRFYIDVSNDEGYIPPDGATGSSWIGNSFWDDSIQVKAIGCDRDAAFNERYKVTNIQELPWFAPTENNTYDRAPDVWDSSTSNFAWPPELDQSNSIAQQLITNATPIYIRRQNIKDVEGREEYEVLSQTYYDYLAGVSAGNIPGSGLGNIGDTWFVEYAISGLSGADQASAIADPFQIFHQGEFAWPPELDPSNAIAAQMITNADRVFLSRVGVIYEVLAGSISENDYLGFDIQGTITAKNSTTRWQCRYDPTGFATAEQDSLAADPFQIFKRRDTGFAEFNSYWINESEGSKQGRYHCIRDEEADARWVRVEETFQVEFDARDYKVLSKQYEPEGCYLFRLGRNYGVDIATDNIQRVLSTQTTAAGTLVAKLDISHLHPTRFAVTVNFNPFSDDVNDPYAAGGTNEYVVKAITLEDVTYNSVTNQYIAVELIVGNSEEYIYHAYQNTGLTFPHNPDDVLPAKNGYFEDEGTGDDIEIRFDMNGPRTIILADFKKVDISPTNDGNIFLYMRADKYLSNSDLFQMFNARLSFMDGQHSVVSVAESSFNGLPCVEVTTSTTGLATSVTESADDAVYVADKWSAPVSNSITMDGLDTLYSYDEANAICVQQSRQGKATAFNGTVATTVQLPAANNYEYQAYVVNGLERITYTSNTFTSVTFQHDSMSGDKEFVWTATRKKSPGVEAIYDRN